jgi:pimeloyl-ACP methyl ester carboxylesterase
LGAVIDQLEAPTIGYIGHSMGSAVGVRRASSDPRIRFLVSISGIAHTAAFVERHFGDLTPGVDTMWEKPGCIYSRAYLEDMQQIGSVLSAAENIHVPWLFVHGTADDVVPLSDSRDLFEKAGQLKQFETIADADHVFTDHTSELVRVVVPWITKLKL